MASYDNLYIDILKLGRDHVKTGLQYNELKNELQKQGYDFSCDCIELAVKQWFYDSFHHKGENGKQITIEELDDHLDCNFIMRGDACLKLISYKTAKLNNVLMWLSVGIALLAIGVSIYLTMSNTPKPPTDTKQETSQ